MSNTRMFNGKVYYLVDVVSSLDVKSVVRLQRSKNYFVRVIWDSNREYAQIWTRKKKGLSWNPRG